MHKDNWNAFANFQVVQLNAVDSHFLKPVFCLGGFPRSALLFEK
jgi:hypothetical protein